MATQKSLCAIILVLACFACGPSPEDVLDAYVYEAERADAQLSAIQVAALGQTEGSTTLLCTSSPDNDHRSNITQVSVQFATTDIGGGFLLPDIDQQTWTYTQWECFTDGVRTDGTIQVAVTHLETGGWTLRYSGAMYVSDSDTCALEATATAAEDGTITRGFSGTFCDEPLGDRTLMVPDFAP